MYSGMGRNSFSQDRELNSVALFKELVKKRSQGGVEIESIPSCAANSALAIVP